jgi:hypothetical protein
VELGLPPSTESNLDIHAATFSADPETPPVIVPFPAPVAQPVVTPSEVLHTSCPVQMPCFPKVDCNIDPGSPVEIPTDHEMLDDERPLDELDALQDLLSAANFQAASRPVNTAPSVTAQLHTYRIVVIPSVNLKKQNALKQLSDLVNAGSKIDPFFKIAPWRLDSTAEPIVSQKTVSFAYTSLRTYFSTRQQHITSLSGELRVISSLPASDIIVGLKASSTLHDYNIFVSNCQAEEKDNVGMMIYATKSVFIPDLLAAIKDTDLWKATMDGCEVGLAMAPFTGATDEKTRCLMVVSARKDTTRTIHFFNECFNTTLVAKPNLLNLYFYPIQVGTNNSQQRCELVRKHKLFTEQERKLLICGFRDLDKQVKLKGGGCRSARQLLMMQRVGNDPTVFLLHGIHRQNELDSHVYFCFPEAHRTQVHECLVTVEARLKALIHPPCHDIVFVDKNSCLTFVGGWPLNSTATAQVEPIENPTEEDIMLQLVRRPALPALQSPPWSTPAAHTTHATVKPPAESHPAPTVLFSTQSTQNIVAVFPQDGVQRTARKPVKFARTAPELTEDTLMMDVVTPSPNTTLLQSEPGNTHHPSELVAVHDRIDGLRRGHKSTKKLMKDIILSLHQNTGDIQEIKTNLRFLTDRSAQMHQPVLNAYDQLHGQPNFNLDSDGDISL